jgi:transposase
MLDDDTVRAWHGSFKTDGVDSIHSFEFKGGSSNLTAEQIEQLRAWATKTLPGTTREIGHFIRTNFGQNYTRSAIIRGSSGATLSRCPCCQARQKENISRHKT